MPGRQAHGRSLLPGPSGSAVKTAKKNAKKTKHSRAQATNNALDAFARASDLVPERLPKGVRTRDLDEEPEERNQKRQRDGDDDDDEFGDGSDDDDEDEAPRKKKPRKNDDDFEGFSGGSDSEGNEWHIGVDGSDEDSDIDSDEAFGDSDQEKFDGYSFGGLAAKKGKRGNKKVGSDEEEEEDDEDDDDLESLGSDAIDLATALDQFSEDDEPVGKKVEDSGLSDEEDGDSSDESSDESSDDEDEDEDDDDPSRLDGLQKFISAFAGDDDEDIDTEPASTAKPKLSLSDLGLHGVKDAHIKKSLKLMNKEERAVKAGSSKKLEVPLAKRQEDQLLRSAAYEKTSETLERWIGTVKHNRRADHLMFPLAQNAHDAGLDNGELQPITQKTSGTELEQTILAIMEESGLGPTTKPEHKEAGAPGPGSGLSPVELKELQRQRRREREMHSREAARAKRVKKIKSKAYRRVHRKEVLHDAEAAHEALAEAGELDSEEEREVQDRRRAAERMGTKHRESKWAKLGKKAGRAVWDDDFRAGLTEMARKNEELRRRVEGRTGGGSDDDDGDDDMSDASGDSGDEVTKKRKLLAQLDKAAAYDDEEPQSALMKMKFMQRGELQRKKENDDLIAQIRRDLDSNNEGDASDPEEIDIGRRQYGMGDQSKKTAEKKESNDAAKTKERPSKSSARTGVVQLDNEAPSVPEAEPLSPAAPGAAGAWSRSVKEGGRKSKKETKAKVDELDLSNAAMLATRSSKMKSSAATAQADNNDDKDSEDEDAIHLPLAIRDQELIKRAFAGEDVVGEFEREKAELENAEDDKEVDNTLPGWGGWVGEGVSNREKMRHKGRFVTKVEGVNKKKRQDYKLKDAIVTEKRVRKNDKYLASGLPFPYESHQQYERALRLPVGPEWMTKESFQEGTKPRVLIKQGIIAPMTKPMV